MKNNALIIIAVLIFSTISVYAIENKEIYVTVGEVDAPVYNVEIFWESMQFSYIEQVNYIWDNESKTYNLGESTFVWSNSNNKINIFNKSTYSINARLDYVGINNNIIGVFDTNNASLSPGTSKYFRLNLEGSLPSNYNTYTKVGTIELKIS